MKKINVLHEFFQHQSDCCGIECSEMEQMENDFQGWFDEQMKDFNFAARFMLSHLSNHHPHHAVYTTNTVCELLEGKQALETYDYICD